MRLARRGDGNTFFSAPTRQYCSSKLENCPKNRPLLPKLTTVFWLFWRSKKSFSGLSESCFGLVQDLLGYFRNVCKLKFAHILSLWDHFKNAVPPLPPVSQFGKKCANVFRFFFNNVHYFFLLETEKCHLKLPFCTFSIFKCFFYSSKWKVPSKTPFAFHYFFTMLSHFSRTIFL